MLGAMRAQSLQVDHKKRKKIEEFCYQYQSASALAYYTEATFFYQVLNSILRQNRVDIIYTYRHAIIDIINCLRRIRSLEGDGVPLTLYRGQLMTIIEVDKLKNNLGELVAVNSFFSTSFSRSVAECFSGMGSNEGALLVSVIFEIHLDTGQPMPPYAWIPNSGEDEVLFSPGTKFRLISCRKLHDDGRLWLFGLQAISEQQQEQLTLSHGETMMLLSSASGWPTSVVVVPIIIT